MRQINAGLKKEWCFFWRSFRFGGIIILFVGAALLYPLLSAMMQAMQGMFETSFEGVTAEVPGMEAFGNMDGLFGMFEGNSGLILSYTSSLGLTSSAVVILMVLLMGTAGAEQKKRSIIIPQTAGLTPSGYVIPKFIIYPLFVFSATLLAAFVSDAVCQLVFKTSFDLGTVILTGSLYGLSGAFTICLYLFLGISTAQPGLSVLYVVAGETVFSLLVTTALRVDRYTPWNLAVMADSIVMNHAYSDYSRNMGALVATMAVSVALCVALMLLTLFAMVAKRMDNTADEVY